MPQKFPFIIDGVYGDVPINYYAAQDSEKGVILQPSPGLNSFSQLTGCSELRGLYVWFDYLYAVARKGTTTTVWRIDTGGNAAEIGEFTTSYTGKVWIESNLTQLAICDGKWIYVFVPASNSFGPVTDADFTGAAGLAYQDGRGIFWLENSTTFAYLDPFDFTAFDPTHIYVMRAGNDNIRNIMSFNEQLWIPGDTNTEIWYYYGGDDTSASNPAYARYQDGVKEVGIGAAATLTDTEGAAVSWVSNKKEIILAAGLAPVAITNQMFSRAIEAMSTYADALAFSYSDQGHKFVQYTFPTGDQTWVFDGTTKLFHKKQSRKSDLTFGRHRANCYAYWNNKHFVGDFENGTIWEMSTEYLADGSEPIRRELYTVPIDYGLNRRRHPPLQIIVDPGQGLIDGTDPQIMMRYTNDRRVEGQTWSSELWRSAGKIGEGYRKSVWWRLGSGSFRMEHIAMTDPCIWRVLAIDRGEAQQ